MVALLKVLNESHIPQGITIKDLRLSDKSLSQI